MGIAKIHILYEVDDNVTQPLRQTQLVIEELVAAHRRGEHTYGNMYRACPLCK